MDDFLHEHGRSFDLHMTKFYAAELVLAIQYLHENHSTAHRDIKASILCLSSSFNHSLSLRM